MLHVVTFQWGKKWSVQYTDRLFRNVIRNVKQPVRCLQVIDPANWGGSSWDCAVLQGRALEATQKPGCLARMILFSRRFQHFVNMKPFDQVVCMDVDNVITGPLDPVFDALGGRDEFAIMSGFNTTNPCPYNGSLWTFRAGTRHDVWEDFSFENYAALNVPFHSFPDDQGWLRHKFPVAVALNPSRNVYAFKKESWPTQDLSLPEGAAVVAFPGRTPNKYTYLDWVKQHWGDKCS